MLPVYRKLARSVKLTLVLERETNEEEKKKSLKRKNGFHSCICIILTEKERKPYTDKLETHIFHVGIFFNC